MSVLQAEVYQAFRILDIDDDRALKAAVALSSALSKVEDDTSKGFSKRDADIEAIRKDVGAIKLDVVGIKGELATMRWMGGILLSMVTVILFKLFLH